MRPLTEILRDLDKYNLKAVPKNEKYSTSTSCHSSSSSGGHCESSSSRTGHC